MSLLHIWNQALPTIQQEIGDTSYETWFASIDVTENDSQTLKIETPDEFFKNWIVEHYQALIEKTLLDISGRNITVIFTVNTNMISDSKSEPMPSFESTLPNAEPKNILRLNDRFTFDNFVIGPANRFACAASLAVAESPAKAYNPLFIYGPVGLGKTHLIQSITHKIRKLHPELKISYMSSEKFTNELIDAIRHRSTDSFRKKYRNIDVLLIDDISFIAGKESTQEEFFHTFNALHDNKKQIIITSDRPPKEISNLEERLRSRFAWGLIADIKPPDFETRVAILRKKVEKEPVKVPQDVIYFIAEQIRTNIRELEGALVRVIAYSLLEEKPITLEMAKVILKDMVKETIDIINVETIQKKVAAYYQVTLEEMKSKRRHKNIVTPRQIAMYLSRRLTNLSLPEIGSAFGGRDHTTILHAFKKIDLELTSNANTQNIVCELTTSLKQ